MDKQKMKVHISGVWFSNFEDYLYTKIFHMKVSEIQKRSFNDIWYQAMTEWTEAIDSHETTYDTAHWLYDRLRSV